MLGVASLVSVHDHAWTTGRRRAVRRWSEVEPDLALDLARRGARIVSWAHGLHAAFGGRHSGE